MRAGVVGDEIGEVGGHRIIQAMTRGLDLILWETPQGCEKGGT